MELKGIVSMVKVRKKITKADLTKSQLKQYDIAYRHLNNKKFPCFYGESGIGKTVMAYLMAKETNATIIEYNASDSRRKADIENILRRIRMKGMNKLIYLFDEVDHFKNWRALKIIMNTSAHPIIFTCNDYWKIPDSIKKGRGTKFVGVRVYPPRKTDIVNFLRKQGVRSGLSRINFDWRSSVNTVVSGGDSYKELTDFDIAKQILVYPHKTPELIKQLKSGFTKFYIWVADNICKFYRGKEVVDAFTILERAVRTNTPELLAFLPKAKSEKVDYPYYLTKRKVHKNNK